MTDFHGNEEKKIQNGQLNKTELFKTFLNIVMQKAVTNYVLEWMRLNFYDYDGL